MKDVLIQLGCGEVVEGYSALVLESPDGSDCGAQRAFRHEGYGVCRPYVHGGPAKGVPRLALPLPRDKRASCGALAS